MPQISHIIITSSIVRMLTTPHSNGCHKYQILTDIQPEHNYVILSGIIQCINYMFQPLLGHHQVVLSSHSNCIT